MMMYALPLVFFRVHGDMNRVIFANKAGYKDFTLLDTTFYTG